FRKFQHPGHFLDGQDLVRHGACGSWRPGRGRHETPTRTILFHRNVRPQPVATAHASSSATVYGPGRRGRACRRFRENLASKVSKLDNAHLVPKADDCSDDLKSEYRCRTSSGVRLRAITTSRRPAPISNIWKAMAAVSPSVRAPLMPRLAATRTTSAG